MTDPSTFKHGSLRLEATNAIATGRACKPRLLLLLLYFHPCLPAIVPFARQWMSCEDLSFLPVPPLYDGGPRHATLTTR